MAYEQSTVATAYSTAKSMGASDKVMLALFEAAIVESGFRNVSYGDQDSVGYLQQRPSQGWPNPMDVATATRSFVNKAMPIAGKYATAGQLAQAVQRSAFPLKYDAMKAPASTLLASQGGVSVTPVGLTGNVDNITKALTTLTRAGTWKRVGVFFAGALMVLYAVGQLTGSTNAAIKAAKGAAKVATKVAI